MFVVKVLIRTNGTFVVAATRHVVACPGSGLAKLVNINKERYVKILNSVFRDI